MAKITTVPVEHKVMGVIDNFQCDVSEIPLTHHLSIRKIDTLSQDEQATFEGEEWEAPYSNFRLDGTVSREETLHVIRFQPREGGETFTRTRERGSHILYWYFKDRVQEPLKDHYNFLVKPVTEMMNVQSALRILKDSIIGLYPQEHFLIEIPPFTKNSRAANRTKDGYGLAEPQNVEVYTLLSDEIAVLQQIFQAIQTAKQPGLLTALSRLNYQYSRASLADRLIDAVIGLEALYAGENKSEVTLRAGLRASAHLGTDSDARERYFNLFNLAYSLRSSLVHGVIHSPAEIEKEVVKKKDWPNNEAFMAALDDMLRQSLRLILTDIKPGKLKDTLHEPLDRAIRRGELFPRS